MTKVHPAIIKTICKEYRETFTGHNGAEPQMAGLRLRWTGQEEEGVLRLFELKQNGRVVAVGMVEEWGSFCEVCLKS